MLPKISLKCNPMARKNRSKPFVLKTLQGIQPTFVIQPGVVLDRVAVHPTKLRDFLATVTLARPVFGVHSLANGFQRIVSSFVICRYNIGMADIESKQR